MRALIAALILAFGLFVCTIEAIGIYTHGSVPSYLTRVVQDDIREIVDVSPGAAQAGLARGDQFRVGENWPLMVATLGFASHGWLSPGTDVPVVIHRGASTRVIHLTAVAASGSQLLPLWSDIAFKFAAMLVGVFLIVRGIGAFGLYAGIGIAGVSLTSGFISNIYIGSPTVSAIIDFSIFAGAVSARYFIVEAMLAICGDGIRPLERMLIRISAIGASAFIVATTTVVAFGGVAHNATIVGMWTNGTTLLAFWFIAQLSLRVDLLGYLLAWSRPARVDRDVIAWTFLSSIVGLSGPTANLVLRLVHQAAPWDGALNLTLILMTAGYAYIALRYRIVNVSFVLNRAVVYAAVGALVLAVFVVVETVATKLAVGRYNSTLLEIFVALILGFTIKQIEQRVDSFVERVLFASKHRLEEGLRQLINDCSHVEHLPALFARACTESRRILGADRVTVYEARDGTYEPLYTSPEGLPVPPADVDDGAFVRLRSRREPIDLEDIGSALGSEGLVFPMLARGRLLGAMYFGPKERRSSYDPDERKLLLDLSHEVGASSLVLSAEQPARV